MTGRPRRRPSAADQHREWLGLVDTDGPFLALPVLQRVWPDGIDRIAPDDKRHLQFLDEVGWWGRDPDGRQTAWVRTVLADLAGWEELLVTEPDLPDRLTVPVAEHHSTVRPWGALFGPGADRDTDPPLALVTVVPPGTDLRAPEDDRWAASPTDRLGVALRRLGVPIGIVTDGRWWALVWATRGRSTGSGAVDAVTWREEPLLRDAFLALVGVQRLVGARPSDRLPQLFEDSLLQQEEVTEQLGTQVRQAVELLVQAFSEARVTARGRGLTDPLPADPREAYEAAVTVMMRVVFLLFAEERGLLPVDRELYRSSYAVSTLLDQLEETARDDEKLLDDSTRVWHRLLAVSRAVHGGATFEDVRMPAYGGSLFDPVQFGFLESGAAAGTVGGGLRLEVNDRVLLHVLRAVQKVRGGRRLSFREIDVEQIGYVYEGLLGYTCRYTSDVAVLSLLGKDGEEPEVDLDTITALHADAPTPAAFADALLGFIAQTQPAAKPPSKGALAKLVAVPVDQGEARRLLGPACNHDPATIAAVLPFYPLLRKDLRGHPYVVPAGGLMLIETAGRANAGAHYTPRALAEEVVEHALAPLVYLPGPLQTADSDRWQLRTSTEILDLKVADIAAGSGAFLVAACRYLAYRLVEAWRSERGHSAPHDSDSASGQRLELRARREIIAHCLYGADINAMAVEMCKLSLWLVSMDRGKPFSFVDDKVLHGNSLLGLTSQDQLRGVHIAPTRARLAAPGFTVDVEAPLARARTLRADIAATSVEEDDPQRSAHHKHAMLARVHEITAQLRVIADAIVAAGLVHGGRPGKALDNAYDALSLTLFDAFTGNGSRDKLDELIAAGLAVTVASEMSRWKPLHWVLEVPDVMERGGFDAVIGNPPFLGGQKLTGAMGTEMRDWFVNQLASGRKGSADLVAYFFLRAVHLLEPGHGQLGLIATNTLAQGDTREVGLDQLADHGMVIRRSIQSRSWPSASANLEYAAVWASLAEPADQAARVADDVPVPRISTLLEAEGRVSGMPKRLAENAGIAFQGSIVLGKGFVLTPRQADELLAEDPRNEAVIFPYLNGEDLNSRPDASASRWVINFHDWCEYCARRYPSPFAIVERLVRRERSNNNRKVYRDRWWQYAERRPALLKAIQGADYVLVMARVSKTVMPLRVPPAQVFDDKIVVFAFDRNGELAVLSSAAHQIWAIKYGTTMRVDPTYTPRAVLETFPFPAIGGQLQEAGSVLDEERREIMLRRQLGLTALYNRVNDPAVTGDRDVDRMREIHVAVDEATMAAYGWEDVPLGHGFHTYRQMRRFTVSPAARVELLDRLLQLNHDRAAAEARQREMSAASGTVSGRGRRRRSGTDGEPGLF